jgi:putative endonuclease
MTDKIKRGNEGEQYAAEFLTEKGFEIVERNYRYRHSEIDLIIKKDNWLIFVEVKTRSSYSFGYPEEFVNYKKVQKILEGAAHYIETIDWQGNVRYDVVSILWREGMMEMLHLEDAFY